MSSLATVNADSTLDGNLTATNTILTCDKNWVLDKKIYVTSGKTITIYPGTVIKGQPSAKPSRAAALIVEKGAKIIADGTQSCPIVFTSSNDPMDGSYGIKNRGDWGGVVVLGKATNALLMSNTYSGSTTQDGIGFIEGFVKADLRNLYGGTDDNDNSGILRYVSIRHAGAILALGNELNALSLGSVGSGTVIEHIETISSADDNIEFFGGTVDVKYASVLFGADDMFDYDLGWRGRGQFWFGMKQNTWSDGSTANTADNGLEMDSDDDKKGLLITFLSNPQIYNITIIGNGNDTARADNSGPAALMSKEYNGGAIYNSVFAKFKMGLNLAKVQSGRTGDNAYEHWNQGSFITKNCTFVNCKFPITVDKKAVGVSGGASVTDSVKFYQTDGNAAVAAFNGIAGFDPSFLINGATNVVSTFAKVVPTSTIASDITAPADGFFSPVAYRGAFDPSSQNWLSDFASVQLLQVAQGTQKCPTDLDGNKATNMSDFLIFVGQFGQSCK